MAIGATVHTFTVNLADTRLGADVWANDGDGFIAMNASIEAV